jgi:hypothetical protein
MTEELSPDTVGSIAREIVRYLVCHPEAKDTLDGIVQWWLRQEGRAHWRRDVKRALALLCSHGLLLETRRPGVPPYYQLNPQQRKAIVKLLDGA